MFNFVLQNINDTIWSLHHSAENENDLTGPENVKCKEFN